MTRRVMTQTKQGLSGGVKHYDIARLHRFCGGRIPSIFYPGRLSCLDAPGREGCALRPASPSQESRLGESVGTVSADAWPQLARIWLCPALISSWQVQIHCHCCTVKFTVKSTRDRRAVACCRIRKLSLTQSTQKVLSEATERRLSGRQSRRTPA